MSFLRTSPLFLLAAIFLFPPKFSYAQSLDNQGLAIRPAIVDQVVEPGETTEIIVELENITENSISIEASVEPMFVIDPFVNTGEKIRYDITDWIVFEQSAWALDAYQNIEVKIRVTPPEDSSPGGHYAQLAFKALTDLPASSGSVAELIPQLNSLLLLTVPGDVITEMEVGAMEVNDFAFTTTISANTEVINKGNSHEIIRVSGKLQNGDDITTIDTEPRLILPGTAQSYPVEFKSGALFARSKVWTEVTFGSPARTISTPPKDVYFVSPILLFALLLVVVAGGSSVGRKSRIRLYSHSSKHSPYKRRYSHPKRKSEKKLIKSGK